jgi:hypothetical protein
MTLPLFSTTMLMAKRFSRSCIRRLLVLLLMPKCLKMSLLGMPSSPAAEPGEDGAVVG